MKKSHGELGYVILNFEAGNFIPLNSCQILDQKGIWRVRRVRRKHRRSRWVRFPGRWIRFIRWGWGRECPTRRGCVL